MTRNLAILEPFQVFLNYPFDRGFTQLGNAMSFAIAAANYIPICALDVSLPDMLRLETVVNTIQACRFSAHDLSRYTGMGSNNLARMNMPLELGAALTLSYLTHRHGHRCAILVPTEHDYKKFASDLSGFDPICHNNNEEIMVAKMYEWLGSVVEDAVVFNKIAITDVVDSYSEFKDELSNVVGSEDGEPSHMETRQAMFEFCASRGWWDWWNNTGGKVIIPQVKIKRKKLSRSKP